MFRKLSLALAVSAALSPIAAYALGLGEIATKSALNERFEAEIELISVDAGEIYSIKATLASPVDFARAGVERPFLLSRLRFEPSILKNGRTVIKVVTRDSVREPFLNFLVEVNWPKGRLIREYTVLLDPPVTTQRKPPRIAAAASTRLTQPTRRTTGTSTAVEAAPATDSGASSYRVRSGDTLWRIADKQRVAGASNEQMMMALFNENPRAFMGNNINRLKAGAFLAIPEREAILSLPARSARAEFLAAAKGTAGKRAKKAVRPAQETERLQIATVQPQKMDSAPAVMSVPADQDKEIDQVKSDLNIVRETGESTRQDTEELRSRIRELEAQLTDIRQLLKLKSNQLAQMQTGSQAEVKDETITDVGQTVPEEEPAPAVLINPEADVDETVASAEVPDQPIEAETLVVAPTPPKPAEEIAEATQPPEPASIPTKAPPVETAPPVKKARQETEPVKESGLLEQVMSNSTLLGIAGAVTVVLLSLGWLLIRRRREVEDEFQESVLLSPDLDVSSAEFSKDLADAQAKSADKTDETSFISDFSPSDIDALQEETGEVDPSAEADVYIAYGRYQQAESLVNQAIEKSPDRLDLQLKLLEIYFTTRNMASFTELAESLHSKGVEQSDPKLWERIQTMGQELAPEHGMFRGASALSGAAAAGIAGIEQQSTNQLEGSSEDLADLDLDLDLETELSEFPQEPSNISGLDDGSVLEPPEMDLGLMESSNAPTTLGDATLPGDKTGKDEPELSLDLDDLGSLEDIDLGDLGFDDLQEPAQETRFEQETPVEPLAVDDYQVTAVEEEDEIPSISLDELELDVSEADGQPESESLSELLTGTDHSEEVETKLDLARAYIEMGDGDGANEILSEVMAEGSDKQKEEAKDLMEQID